MSFNTQSCKISCLEISHLQDWSSFQINDLPTLQFTIFRWTWWHELYIWQNISQFQAFPLFLCCSLVFKLHTYKLYLTICWGSIQVLRHQRGGWVGSENGNFWWFTVLVRFWSSIEFSIFFGFEWFHDFFLSFLRSWFWGTFLNTFQSFVDYASLDNWDL